MATEAEAPAARKRKTTAAGMLDSTEAAEEPRSEPNPNPSASASGFSSAEGNEWSSFRDDEIMKQHSEIQAVEAVKIPFVGDKEPIAALAAEFQYGSPILQEKIKLIAEQYLALRRTRGDGNCFFRSFMFSYLEHILETQDKSEVERIIANIEMCKKTLKSHGFTDFTFEDFFSTFLEQLESVSQGKDASISHDELLERSRDQSISDYVVMFFRFVTTGELRSRSEFFEPFILGLTNNSNTVDQFCKTSVEPMGEESDHVHITALSDALGVAIRVVYLDRSSCEAGPVTINHHDFIPSAPPKLSTERDDSMMASTNIITESATVSNSSEQKDGTTTTAATTENSRSPFVTLLYRPGHYDILYPK